MTIKPEVLDAMVAAGCTAEQIAAAVKADQARSSGAERQARYRARKASQSDERNATTATVTIEVPPKKETSPTPPKEKTTPSQSEPNGSSQNKRGCRIPDGFAPDIELATSMGLSYSQADTEAAKFRDYWASVAGAKGVKLDWPATWRNWVRHAVERLPRGSPAPRAPKHDPFKALSQELADEQDRSRRSDRRDWDDAEGVPLLTIEHHG